MTILKSIQVESGAGIVPNAPSVRRLARVAHGLTHRHYPCFGEQVAVYRPSFPRAFRRAFVEVSCFPPFQVVPQGEGWAFLVGRACIASIDAAGQLTVSKDGISPISLGDPHGLAYMAISNFVQALEERYAKLTGRPVTWAHRDLNYTDYAGAHGRRRLTRMCRLAQGAMKAFCAHLPQEPLLALRRARMTGWYNLPEIKAAFGVDTRRYWTQALNAYPVLMRWAFASDSWPANVQRKPEDDGDDLAQLHVLEKGTAVLTDAVAKAVTAGDPLVPVLARRFAISEAAVRRYQGLFPQRVTGIPSPVQMRLIAELPPHLRPVTRRDFDECRRLASMLDANRMVPPDMVVFMGGIKHALGDHPWSLQLESLADALDGLSPARRQMLARLPLRRIAEFNREWHRAHQDATEAAYGVLRENPVTEVAWPGVLPGGVMALGELLAVELTRPGELVREGAALSHCVGGYSHVCYQGSSRIISLRTRAGASRSTIELRQEMPKGSKTPRLAITQHYAFENQPPAPEDLAAAKALMRQLRVVANLHWPNMPIPPTQNQRFQEILDTTMHAFTDAWFRKRIG